MWEFYFAALELEFLHGSRIVDDAALVNVCFWPLAEVP
jgi:hypothetical protein